MSDVAPDLGRAASPTRRQHAQALLLATELVFKLVHEAFVETMLLLRATLVSLGGVDATLFAHASATMLALLAFSTKPFFRLGGGKHASSNGTCQNQNAALGEDGKCNTHSPQSS